jgi:signal transduction histidine kinase
MLQARADSGKESLEIVPLDARSVVRSAAKYTARGGLVEVALTKVDGIVATSASDTGIGIAAPDLAHIFDRFWRADKARSREQGGAGLGLSIANWIVGMHGGTITVASEPGKGSVFESRVPIQKC